MNMNMKVSEISMIAMAVSLAVCMLVPIGSCIYMKNVKKAKLKNFFFGCLTFFAFAMILEQLLHFAVFQSQPLKNVGEMIKNNVALYAIYGGIAAALFEETGRFIVLKLIMKSDFSKKNALMYGMGHGGFEAIYIGGTACISNLGAAIAINNGSFSVANSSIDAQTFQQISQLCFLPFWQFLLIGMERMSAFVLQICLSYFIYKAVKNKKFSYFLLAFMIHFGIDAGAVLLSGKLEAWMIEIILLAIIIVIVLIVRNIYKSDGSEPELT